jgi:hypothetical protein
VALVALVAPGILTCDNFTMFHQSIFRFREAVNQIVQEVLVPAMFHGGIGLNTM